MKCPGNAGYIRLAGGFQGVEEFAGRNYRGLAGKDFVHQAGVDFRILIGAAIFDYDQPVIGVGRVAECGKNDAAGGNAEQDESVDVFGAQDHVEIGAGEGAYAMLGNYDVVRLRGDRGMNLAGWAREHLLVLSGILDGAEGGVAGTDFRKVGAEADLHVEDRHAYATRPGEKVGGAGQQGLIFRCKW